MTLALRLQIAFGLLALVATAAIGLLARTAWQTAEEERFDQQLDAAGKGGANQGRPGGALAAQLRQPSHQSDGRAAPGCDAEERGRSLRREAVHRGKHALPAEGPREEPNGDRAHRRARRATPAGDALHQNA